MLTHQWLYYSNTRVRCGWGVWVLVVVVVYFVVKQQKKNTQVGKLPRVNN